MDGDLDNWRPCSSAVLSRELEPKDLAVIEQHGYIIASGYEGVEIRGA